MPRPLRIQLRDELSKIVNRRVAQSSPEDEFHYDPFYGAPIFGIKAETVGDFLRKHGNKQTKSVSENATKVGVSCKEVAEVGIALVRMGNQHVSGGYDPALFADKVHKQEVAANVAATSARHALRQATNAAAAIDKAGGRH